jgi:hypothetical protein
MSASPRLPAPASVPPLPPIFMLGGPIKQISLIFNLTRRVLVRSRPVRSRPVEQRQKLPPVHSHTRHHCTPPQHD